MTVEHPQMSVDPSRKNLLPSQEVISITGHQTMSSLGPSRAKKLKESAQLKHKAMLGKQFKKSGNTASVGRIQPVVPHKLDQPPSQEFIDHVSRSHKLIAKLTDRPNPFEVLSGEAFVNPEEIKPPEPEARHPYQKFRYLARGLPSRAGHIDDSLAPPIPIQLPGTQEESKREMMETTLGGGESPGGGFLKSMPESFTKSLPTDRSKWSELDKLIYILQSQPEDRGEFYYLNKPSKKERPGRKGKSEAVQEHRKIDTNPYNLEPVETHSFEQLNESCFYTLSKKGITSYVHSQPVEFLSLSDWVIERAIYNEISVLPFFKRFRAWKTLKMWRKNIIRRKREYYAKQLQEKLFILDKKLGGILVEHRKKCVEMEKQRIIDLSGRLDVMSLERFATSQKKKRDDVAEAIDKFSRESRKNFKDGIRDILSDLNTKFSEDKEAKEETSPGFKYMGGKLMKKDQQQPGETQGAGFQEKKGGNIRSETVYEALGFSGQLDYKQRSQLRNCCSRFLRFAYLLDFLAMEALTNIYNMSVEEAKIKLKEMNEVSPPAELKQMYSKFSDAEAATVAGEALYHNPGDPEPLFNLSCTFIVDRPIPDNMIRYREIKPFVPPPAGNSTVEDFHPVCHLEIDKDAWVSDEELMARALKEQPKDRDDTSYDFHTEPEIIKAPYVPRIQECWLRLQPNCEAFQRQINECFVEGLESLNNFERWSRHEELLPYANALEEWDDKVAEHWEALPSNKLRADGWLNKDHSNELRKQINDLITSAFQKADTYLELLQPWLQEYWINTQINFSLIRNENLKNPIEVLTALIVRFDNQYERFFIYLPQITDLGMMKIDMRAIKRVLVPNPMHARREISELIPSFIRERCEVMKDWLDESIYRISGQVQTVDEFVDQANALHEINQQLQMVKDKVDYYNQLQHLCSDQKIKLRSEDKNNLTQVQTKLGQLNQAVMNAQDSADRNKATHISILNKMIPKLEEDTKCFLENIKHKKYHNNNSEMFYILRELDRAEAQCRELEHRAQEYHRYQITLELQESQFHNVEEARTQLNVRKDLWHSLKNWSDLVQKWNRMSFNIIDVQQISEVSQKYSKTVSKCELTFTDVEDASAVKTLKKLVYKFKETMPIVVALGNQNLKTEHWEEIHNLLGQPGINLAERDFNLGQLIAINVADYQEQIQEISVTATQEANLRQMIETIDEFWKNREFELKAHKKDKEGGAGVRGDINLLTGTEELNMQLDEALLNMNNVLGSRYVKRVLEKAQDLKSRLDTYQETVEEWIVCQRNWIYLENIFSSSDIKKRLSAEHQEFEIIDASFKRFTQKVYNHPKVSALPKGTYEELSRNNAKMEKIQKQLDEYLEQKRMEFPRFYFLSSDELLEVLANAINAAKIEKHLNKMFDNIHSLLADKMAQGQWEIKGLRSLEGEVLSLALKPIKTKPAVEQWLKSVEFEMQNRLTKHMRNGYNDYLQKENKGRPVWVRSHLAQVVLTIASVFWTETCQILIEALRNEEINDLQQLVDTSVHNLEDMVKLIRGDLDPIHRQIINTLIIQDVHNRDVAYRLRDERVMSTQDFLWQQQLRFEWIDQDQRIVVRQINAELDYGWEYIGPTTRLVITPLTDRCWITITGALHIKLGAAPAGPAGTGKTESTKDLAKGLGIMCVVFNCSEQIEFKMMARLFSGLVQQGAWTCLDEFNRIEIEVLSVIAEQLLTIRLALLKYEEREEGERFTFEFNNVEKMPLNPKCGVFVTMNPGYQGRTELPDNLKILFRSVAMMIPDYGIIAEIMLFSQGFSKARELANKMVQLYKLASEQLSQQDHYDFGMRAVKSVLVMAGSLKRSNPKLTEDALLIRAMRDSNIPKFLAEDLPLFQALIQDLFPGVAIPDADYGELKVQVLATLQSRNLQPVPEFVTKIYQLFDTFNVRFGVMLVGPTCGGKTTCYRMLAEAMSELHRLGSKDERMHLIKTKVLNPKAITMGELYGEVHMDTKEWNDGLASKIIRGAVKKLQKKDDDQDDDTVHRKKSEAMMSHLSVNRWIIFDGPVDALWIENMNTVLDDSMMLCLANGERIKLNKMMHILFEVQDLKQASPATVSRCGMVYLTPSDLGWKPYVESWLAQHFSGEEIFGKGPKDYFVNLFYETVEKALQFLRMNRDSEPIRTVEFQSVANFCGYLQEFFTPAYGFSKIENFEKKDNQKKRLVSYFAFAYFWAFGGSLKHLTQRKVDDLFRGIFTQLNIPLNDTVFEYYIDEKTLKFVNWSKRVPTFEYQKDAPYFSLLVPTVDTMRYSHIIEFIISAGSAPKPLFITGDTGVGKSVIVQNTLSSIQEPREIVPVYLNFSAQTSSLSTQQSIEAKLEKKRGRKHWGVQGQKKCIIFVDDINMPAVEKYGAQPPIELLRQLLDFRGFYDRTKLYWKNVENTTILAAAAPPEAGRPQLTERFTRHFNVLNLRQPSQDSMRHIFESIILGFLHKNHFQDAIRKLGSIAVFSTVELYNNICKNLLPTPTKFHYLFNLRDVSKVFQGILMIKSQQTSSTEIFTKLWIHECCRVFYDRLINEKDRAYVQSHILALADHKFGYKFEAEVIFGGSGIIFTHLLSVDKPRYQESVDTQKLRMVLIDQLDDYNRKFPSKMNLVFFDMAIVHITRIARILAQPRGSAILIGVSGSGKQSLTKLATFVMAYRFSSIKLSKNYKPKDFREDLKEVMMRAGCDGERNLFLLSDTQIVHESFLEDINNILNTGEITNLFKKAEDAEKINEKLRPVVREMKRIEKAEVLYQTFIERVRENFHIFLAMSPIGDQLRIRCRKFPSLVNCCNLDWFDSWPSSALISVSSEMLSKMDGIRREQRDALSLLCKNVHLDVEETAETFYEELRRRVYVTPKNFLGLIETFESSLTKKRREVKQSYDRLANGVHKLKSTNEQVHVLQIQQAEMKPMLVEKRQEASEQLELINSKRKEAMEHEQRVEYETSKVNAQAQEIRIVRDDAKRELDKAMPEMREALKAVDCLKKRDLDEIKQLKQPPLTIQIIMKGVFALLGLKNNDWQDIQVALTTNINFLDMLRNYEINNVSVEAKKKISLYVDRKEFDPKVAAGASEAAKSLALWCRAVKNFDDIKKNKIDKKEAKLRELQSQYDVAVQILMKQTNELEEIQGKVRKLQESYNQQTEDCRRLAESIKLTEQRLERADKLKLLLADEGKRWEATIVVMEKELQELLGNVFVGAASVAYIGPFTGAYREMLVQRWLGFCNDVKLVVSENYSIISTLGNPVEIRNWGVNGLPSDGVSIENGIFCTKSNNWPLMIDPQTQANTWIKNMEGRDEKSQLVVVKLNEESGYMRIFENALITGKVVLLEEVPEEIDPALDSVIARDVFEVDGAKQIKFNDKDIAYDNKFKLYITSKLSRPHFLPELTIKVTLINFTVTFEGLQEQMLAEVVVLERPEIEEERDRLIREIAEGKDKLHDYEVRILKNLSESSEETILNQDKLIDSLREAKDLASVVTERVEKSVVLATEINLIRNQYTPISIRGSILYFVIADLAGIDPMYQYSLSYVKQIFSSTIQASPKSKSLDTRLSTILKNITYSIYKNICRGLFEAHKIIFSFLIATSINRKAGKISEKAWNLLLRGVSLFNKDALPKNPARFFFSEVQWQLAYSMEISVTQSFPDFTRHLADNLSAWQKFSHDLKTLEEPAPKPYNKIDQFDRLLLLKLFRPQTLLDAFTKYVREELGKQFAVSPSATMEALFEDSHKLIPIIFVLSTGADPTNALLKFGKECKFEERIHVTALGQGQGEKASNLIEKGKEEGLWVLLQNCHLARTWMPQLNAIVEKFSAEADFIHQDFRLFLTSMPEDYFPVAILQNGLKMTTEPPHGLKSNLKRSFKEQISDEMLQKDCERHSLIWRKLLFNLTFFHAIVQERRKFGPLGWNKRYEFNDTDLETSITMLKNFLNEMDMIPWDAMRYVTGEINYGGRVTDDWDRITLLCILRFYYNEQMENNEDYVFTKLEEYRTPSYEKVEEYLEYINSLPDYESPQLFGMHENANITFQTQQSNAIINAVLTLQPRVTTKKEGELTSDEIVLNFIEDLQNRNPDYLDPAAATDKKLFKKNEMGLIPCLSTVLLQEVERFNTLLKTINLSLETLKKAIGGQVVMSPVLDEMYSRITLNRVPPNWSEKAYPSLKPLSSWVKDLYVRVEIMRNWIEQGEPKCFWLPGFFFPQGFITGVFQTHARKTNTPIDTLEFQFTVQNCYKPEEFKKPPKDGVYVYGLFLQGAKWDNDRRCLADSDHGIMFSAVPVIYFRPRTNFERPIDYYSCPVYKTTRREGVLSTRGVSDNYILAVDVLSTENVEKWTLRGCAMFCQLDD